MKSQIEKINKLEKEYFRLYDSKSKENIKHKTKYEVLSLNEGDWIYCDGFKTANKVKKIQTNDYVTFWFAEKNGVASGVLSFVENRQEVKTRRYATLQEIEMRLVSEIEKIKNDTK